MGDCNSGSRKKPFTGGKRAASKIARYSAPKRTLIFEPCRHNTDLFACVKFRPRDLKVFRANFFEKPDKVRQDSIISTLIKTKEVKRRRPRTSNKNKTQKRGGEHDFSASYFLPTRDFGKIPVCQKFLLSVLPKVGRTRLKRIARNVHASKPMEDKRGGDRKSHLSLAKKESVREFVRNLRGTESHYNRQKSKRIYLSCDLSVQKIF